MNETSSSWARCAGNTRATRPLQDRLMSKQRRNQTPRPQPVLGVDIGGVIVDRISENSDTSFFGDQPMETPAVDGAFAALTRLAAVFEHRVHIVSKAGPQIAALSREWLGHHGVFEPPIGIPESNVWFVSKRPDKAPICARLGVTHFVDDRPDVLQHLTTVHHQFLFLGGLGHHQPPVTSPRSVHRVSTWPELVVKIERTVKWMQT